MEHMVQNNHDMVIRHETQIKELYKRQNELLTLTKSVNELALSVKALVTKTEDVEKRMDVMEEEKRGRTNTVWACVVTGLISAAISYLVSGIL